MKIEDIIKLGEEWNVLITNRLDKHDFDNNVKGYCCPDERLIKINKPNIENLKDYNITLVHEFMHAVYPNMSESGVEFISRYYVDKKPEYHMFIKKLFDLPTDLTKHL